MNIEIKNAVPEDAGEILELQKKSFESEARLYNDYNIEPLKETRDQFLAEMGRNVILKAELDGKIIGSVRGIRVDKGGCYIGRLIVHPDYQNRGIGTRLMTEIEHMFRNCRAYELFTGERSEKNITLYRKLGYRIEGTKKLSDHVTAVQMVKINQTWNG